MRLGSSWTAFFLVGLGGFAGSVSRYGLSVAFQRFFIEWPAGTLLANFAGCLLVGIVTELSARGDLIAPEVRLLLAAGFCGGFTTMSSMVYETSQMVRSSEYLHAGAYAAGSVLLSMIGFVLGVLAVRVVFRAGGGLWN